MLIGLVMLEFRSNICRSNICPKYKLDKLHVVSENFLLSTPAMLHCNSFAQFNENRMDRIALTCSTHSRFVKEDT